MKSWYSNLLSDSRFPVNDVSLWDQAYMTASMFKAVLSQLILENCQQIGNHNYFKNPSSIRWRILGIQYDKLGLSEKGYKLASIKWYRKTIEEIDEEIKKILEVEYPIGNEIYRDETGIYFIVGEDLGKDNGEFAYLDEDLKNIENKIVEVFKNKLEGEICPTILMTKASRGLMNLGFLLEKAKENFLKKKVINNELELNINKAIGICPLCKIRLIYEEDKQKNNSPTICKTCNERVHHKVVETWLDNLNGETIWTSEIKDSQNRIALISLKFELKDWLNGNLLNSLVMREEDYEKYKNDIKLFIILFLTNIDLKKILLEEKAKALEIKLKNIEIKLKERNLDSKEKERLIKQKKSLVPIKILTDKLTKLIEEIRNEHWYKKNLSENLQQIQGYTNTFDELISEINIKVNEINDIESTVLKIKQIINPFEKLSPEAYNGCKNNNETFDDYIRQIFFGSIIGTPWEDWIRDNDILNNEINWQEEKIEWDKITDENDPALDLLATLLLQLLLRKNPSPARLRRIWETTEEFFEDIKKDIYIYIS
ncbi:MAG: CRISPR-associated protein Csx11 [Hydrogenothermaceae bacterium]|nr:CRISPR-associated protein Csx11 [Hydrogenothermaceae bacterium]